MTYLLGYQNKRLIRVTISRFLLICIITNIIALCSGKPISPYYQWHRPRFYDSDEEFEDPHRAHRFHHPFYHNYQDLDFPNFERSDNIEQHTEKVFKTSTEQVDTMRVHNLDELDRYRFRQLSEDDTGGYPTPNVFDRIAPQKPDVEIISAEKTTNVAAQNDAGETMIIEAENVLRELMRTKLATIRTNFLTGKSNEVVDDEELEECVESILSFLKNPYSESKPECVDIFISDSIKHQNWQAKEFADKMTKINVTRLKADLRAFQANLTRLYHLQMMQSTPTTESISVISNCISSIASFLNSPSFDSRPECIDVTVMMDEDKYQIGASTTDGTAVDRQETTESVLGPSQEVHALKELTTLETTTITKLEVIKPDAEPSYGVAPVEELTPIETIIVDEIQTAESDVEPSEMVDAVEEPTPEPTKPTTVNELQMTESDVEPSETIDAVEELTSVETTTVNELQMTESGAELSEEVDSAEELTPVETTTVNELQMTESGAELSEEVHAVEKLTPVETTTVNELQMTESDAELSEVDSVEDLTPVETTTVNELQMTESGAELSEEVDAVEKLTPVETTTVNELQMTESDAELSEEVDAVEELTPVETTTVNEIQMTESDVEPSEAIDAVEELTSVETTTVNELQMTESDTELSEEVDAVKELTPIETTTVDEVQMTESCIEYSKETEDLSGTEEIPLFYGPEEDAILYIKNSFPKTTTINELSDKTMEPQDFEIVDHLETVNPLINSIKVTTVADERESDIMGTDYEENGTTNCKNIEVATPADVADSEKDIKEKPFHNLMQILKNRSNPGKTLINDGQMDNTTRAVEQNPNTFNRMTFESFTYSPEEILKLIGFYRIANKLLNETKTIEVTEDITDSTKSIESSSSEHQETTSLQYENNDQMEIGFSTSLRSIDDLQSSIPNDYTNETYDDPDMDDFGVVIMMK